ncbi:MAG: DUF6273 domain-containing protein [Oscillospiraceae bacterium]|nr:DUF6273 domain-containing protein [Oscillospiraceae bacterium]
MKKKVLLITIIAAVLIVGIAGFFFWRSSEKITAETIKVGDYVLFGSYNDEPILWRCVDTGNGVMLLSEYILCMKAYDAAESGERCFEGGSYTKNVDAQRFGSEIWKTSNIREWLNSDKTEVKYSTQPPVAPAVLNGANAYADEAGFLTNFTKAERKNILPVTHNGCTDQVYILSAEEVTRYITDGSNWPSENGALRYLTDAAKAKSEHDGIFHSDATGLINPSNEWWYYTRSITEEPYDGKNIVDCFGGGPYYYYYHVFYGVYPSSGYGGILPALNLKSDKSATGDGTLENPWVLG